MTLVIAFPAGGDTDIFGRIFAPRLSELLGQPVIVENVVGEGVMGGAYRVARAAPFFLPGGTPAPIVQKLNHAIVAAMNTSSVQRQLEELGVTLVAPERRSPEYLQKFVVSEIEKWAPIIRRANVRAE